MCDSIFFLHFTEQKIMRVLWILYQSIPLEIICCGCPIEESQGNSRHLVKLEYKLSYVRFSLVFLHVTLQGLLAQSVASLTANQQVTGTIPGLVTFSHWRHFYGHNLTIQLVEEARQKNGHLKVLVNISGGLPRTILFQGDE